MDAIKEEEKELEDEDILKKDFNHRREPTQKAEILEENKEQLEEVS